MSSAADRAELERLWRGGVINPVGKARYFWQNDSTITPCKKQPKPKTSFYEPRRLGAGATAKANLR